MRSYRQYCPLARALDLVGERWTLLIVRELAIRESRYSDLRDALPGLATNLLAERLRRLESDGLIERYEAPRPVGATVYRLTDRGRGLLPAMRELARWGTPLLAAGAGGDAVQVHWLGLVLPVWYAGVALDDVAPLVVALPGGDTATILVTAAGLQVRPGLPAAGEHPAADTVEVSGPPEAVVQLLSGAADRRGRTPAGTLTVVGPRDAVRRLRTLTSRAGHRPDQA